jgi:hypothetical protein
MLVLQGVRGDVSVERESEVACKDIGSSLIYNHSFILFVLTVSPKGNGTSNNSTVLRKNE